MMSTRRGRWAPWWLAVISLAGGCTCGPRDEAATRETATAPAEPRAEGEPSAAAGARDPEPPPTGEDEIPEWCDLRVRLADVAHRATLREIAEDVASPAAEATDEEMARSLCASVGLEWTSASCPREGPWPAIARFDLVLVRPRSDGYEVVLGLSSQSPGTESSSSVESIALRSRAPVVMTLEQERSEQVCDGDDDDVICGMVNVATVSRVVLERSDGTFVVVDALTAPPGGGVEHPLSAALEGDRVRVGACGGSALRSPSG